jgi:sulfatase modifying factor 1
MPRNVWIALISCALLVSGLVAAIVLGWAAGSRVFESAKVEALDALPRPIDTEMVFIPAGEFLFGEELKKVHLPAFYIDRYEVSQAQYGVFLEYIRRTNDHSKCHPSEPPGKDHTPLVWGQPSLSAPNFPVVGVDYWDAYAYASWVGKRLPTELEWEKAARGTDGRLYPWGNTWDPSRCNWGPAPGLVRTLVPVDSMPEGQSPYGCFHMLGNAAEWTDSVVDSDRGLRVGKGYCWALGDLTPYVVTYRMIGHTQLRDLGSGLRCAKDAPVELGGVAPSTSMVPARRAGGSRTSN